ncbi:glycosyltransferase family 2 protein [Nonlabens sp.]|uniref:glycosyltransferase family 2 protein n=1 Tax=Nonlabens sp. TaxID=1888209 RepID=UPI003F6A4B22
MKVTIAICTFNRSFYLKKCIDALLPQLGDHKENLVLMIIDNNSKDDTAELIDHYINSGLRISYYKELKQGLSNARNRAIKECDTEYLGYLDDDAIPHDNYVDKLIEIIHAYQPDCFGGMYYPYYETKKPKWISDNFGKKTMLTKSFSKVDQGNLSGGNMYCKLKILLELNGFDPSRGMNGTKIGYAEEDELQLRIRKAGYSIYFDPQLAMDHLVAPYKTKISWHIKRAYHSNRNTFDTVYKKYTFLHTIKVIFRITFYKIPHLIKLCIKRPDYYFENFILDIGTSYTRAIGLYFNRNKN